MFTKDSVVSKNGRVIARYWFIKTHFDLCITKTKKNKNINLCNFKKKCKGIKSKHSFECT
jgi:hypothetical protein